MSGSVLGISGSQLAWVVLTSFAITLGVFLLLVVRDGLASSRDRES